jgi:hypothetical protein
LDEDLSGESTLAIEGDGAGAGDVEIASTCEIAGDTEGVVSNGFESAATGGDGDGSPESYIIADTVAGFSDDRCVCGGIGRSGAESK